MTRPTTALPVAKPTIQCNTKVVLTGFDNKSGFCYNNDTVTKQEPKMATAIYEALSVEEKREVRMYGVTVAGMREAVESSITFRLSGPAMVAMGMLSDAQEMMAYEQPDFNTIEDQRQLINRAKWVLSEYVMCATV